MDEIPARAAASLIDGRSITRVRYCLLDDGQGAPEQWDFDGCHVATMGVEVATDDGRTSFITWQQEADGWALTEEPDSPLAASSYPFVDVSHHPRWRGLVGLPISVSALPDRDADGRRIALQLAAGDQLAWIIAGTSLTWPPDGQFRLGTDDVSVLFDPGLASRVLGPPIPAPPTPNST